MHNLNDMLKLLMRLSLHYPQARYTDDELKTLALDWSKDLQGYAFDVLSEAAQKARREERFFPNVATMRDKAAAVLTERRMAMREIPAPPMTPEKMTRNARLAWLLRRKIDGDVDAGLEFARILGLPTEVRQ